MGRSLLRYFCAFDTYSLTVLQQKWIWVATVSCPVIIVLCPVAGRPVHEYRMRKRRVFSISVSIQSTYKTIKKVPVYRRDRACTIVCCTSRDNTGQIGQIKSDVQRVRVVLNCPDFDTPSCNFAFTPNFNQVTPQHRSSDLRRFLFVFVIFFGFFFCPFRTNVYSMRVRVRTFLRACGFRAKTSDAYNNVRNNT